MTTNETHAEVPQDLDGVRADRVVAVLCALPRAEARRIIDQGDVTVDGRGVAPAERLNAGSVVVALIPPREPQLAPEPVEFGVCYLDPEVIVVDKPPGLVVHPGAGTRTTTTLVAGLVHRFPELGDLDEQRWGLVHRLDRDTSGLLMVGRTVNAFHHLQHELRQRRIERVYLTLVDGVPEAARGTVDAPIGRDPDNPVRMAVVRDGRPARSHYRRLAAWDDAALLEVRLETGRTHQIRVHLASIGHPVVGDGVYDRRRRRSVADPGRQWLHAARLAFVHPSSGERVEVTAPLPADLLASLPSLGEPTAGSIPVWENMP